MTNFCNKCGNKIENNEQFCPKCGNQLNYDNLNKQTNKKKTGYVKILILTLLCIVGFFILGWLVSFVISLCGISVSGSVEYFTTTILNMIIMLALIFSPLIALVIYLVKNSNTK